MANRDLLKRIARNLSTPKVDFSALDTEVNKLKQSLEETVNIQTIDDVKYELNKFQKKIDFTPLITEIENIRTLFGEQVKELEKRITNKTQALLDVEGKKDENERAILSGEINTLQSQLNVLKSDATLSRAITEINNVQSLFGSRLTSLSDELKTYQTKEESQKIIQDTQDALDTVKKELIARIAKFGGGSMNRQMFIGGVDPLTKFTDMNLKAGSNVTITYANNNTTKKVDVTFAAIGGGGAGITRSINSISTPTTAGNAPTIDYVYLVSGTTTLTLPDATANTNLYTVKNVGSGVVTVATTSAQTIDGSANAVLPLQYTAIDVESDGSNWNIT